MGGGDPEPIKKDCKNAAGKQFFQGLCLTVTCCHQPSGRLE